MTPVLPNSGEAAKVRELRVYVCGCRQWGPADHGTCLTCNEEIHSLPALPLYGPPTLEDFMADWNAAEMDEYHREQMRERPARGLHPLAMPPRPNTRGGG